MKHYFPVILAVFALISLGACGSSSSSGGGGGGGGAGIIMLPDTGSTTCIWLDMGVNTVDDGCVETYIVGSPTHPQGQDAHYVDTPAAIDMTVTDGDATVTDNLSELVWQRCAKGQTLMGANCDPAGMVDIDTQADALTYCDTLTLAGRSWRLPSIREFNFLYSLAQTNPILNPAMFPDAPADQLFWSSTEVAGTGTDAWSLWTNFLNITAETKTLNRGTRCISGPVLPDYDLVDNGNGTVTEQVTGLVWTRCGFTDMAAGTPDTSTDCSGTHDADICVTAINACEGLTFAC
jgi:hypothetical protein